MKHTIIQKHMWLSVSGFVGVDIKRKLGGFEMASKSQSRFMITCTLVIGSAGLLSNKCKDERIKTEINTLADMAKEALKLRSGNLTSSQFATWMSGLKALEEEGVDDIATGRAYTSMLIGVVGDRIAEIPETSEKHKAMTDIINKLDEIYGYYASKNHREDLDEAGCKFMARIDQLFGKAA